LEPFLENPDILLMKWLVSVSNGLEVLAFSELEGWEELDLAVRGIWVSFTGAANDAPLDLGLAGVGDGGSGDFLRPSTSDGFDCVGRDVIATSEDMGFSGRTDEETSWNCEGSVL
jgi:hypothetical protein